jgi:hypothetical protein
MWVAQVRANALSSAAYRSTEPKKRKRAEAFHGAALDEALEMMGGEQTLDAVARKKAKHIKGAITWARLADGVANALTSDVLGLRTEDALREAVERASLLHARLEERDGSKQGRVTHATREAIGLVTGVARVLGELRAVRDGKVTADYETAGRAASLRQRWNRIGGESNGFVRRLMEECVAHVLASDSQSGAVRAVYTRALTQWQAPTPPLASDGEQLTWDSDDDLL